MFSNLTKQCEGEETILEITNINISEAMYDLNQESFLKTGKKNANKIV